MRTFAQEVDVFIDCIDDTFIKANLSIALAKFIQIGTTACPTDYVFKSIATPERVKPSYENLEKEVADLRSKLQMATYPQDTY